MVEVKGKKYVTWEMQAKEGRHRAIAAKVVHVKDDEVLVTARNVTEISGDKKSYSQVIHGQASMLFARHGKDGYQLDIDIDHQPVEGEEVTITKYRYSGFCWRGSPAWTSETSAMLASGGHNRDKANHQAANWCLVSGETPKGKATMLILSKAVVNCGEPELLRVWDSKTHHGNPFVNFNPVVKKPMLLNEENKAVSRRSYRLIMVDHELKAEEASRLWKQWADPAK
jgi:hypothetical protein